MLPFKQYLAAAASTHFAKQVVATLDERGEIDVSMRLPILKPLLVRWVHDAIVRLQDNESLR